MGRAGRGKGRRGGEERMGGWREGGKEGRREKERVARKKRRMEGKTKGRICGTER